MFNLQRSSRYAVRLATVALVMLAALPLATTVASDNTAAIEVDLIDRRESPDGDRVHGTLMIRLRLRSADGLSPLANATVTFKPRFGSKSGRITAMSNEHGMVQIDAAYAVAERGMAAIQIVDINHKAVAPGATMDQSFAFHGDPLPAVFVYDRGNFRIQKLTLDGSFITSWGQEGSGPGEFCATPHGSLAYGDLALDSFSNVYVTDSCQRVQKFNSNGDFLMQWGSDGDAPGQFEHAIYGIAIDDADHVYVTSKNRIQRFDSNGVFQMLISTAEQTPKPGDVGIDPDGDLWIGDDQGHNLIFEFSATGDYLGSNYLGGLNNNFLLDNDGTFYGSQGYKVAKVSPDWSEIESWGPVHGGTGIGEFSMPWAFALAGDHLYVLERGNDRVQMLTTDGDYVATFGAHGDNPGQFVSPSDIAIFN